MEIESVFENKLFLELKNKKAESDFQNFVNKQRIKYNKWFSGALLLLFIGDLVFQNISFKKSTEKIPKMAYILIYTCYILCFISLILFILSLFITKYKTFLTYANFILLMFPFIDFRELLAEMYHAKVEIALLIRTLEVLIRVIMIMLVLTAFPHGLYINLVLLIFVVFYNSLIQQYYDIYYYVLAIIVYISISYFYSKAIKEVYLIKIQMNDQMNWYSNLFEHLHCGFISITGNHRIKILNKSLLEIVYKNKEIEKFKRKLEDFNEENGKILSSTNILNVMRTEDTITIEDIIKNNSEEFLKILLEGIYLEYYKKESKELLNIGKEKKIFDLKNYLNEIKEIYKTKQMNEKFMFIGFKDLEVEEVNDSHSENIDKTKEIMTMEVYLRWHYVGNSNEEECEILFNDISITKNAEQISAELKYKTMFLSKISHEFKNPVIWISELVKKFHETYSSELININNLKLRESFKHLKQIVSVADYLLILIKDLDFYSQLQIKKEIHIKNEIVDFNEILDFCHKMADMLLHKFNKQNNVKFVIENNLSDSVVLTTDAIRLKQLFINLISNAIKCTNKGVIKLKLDLIINDGNKINFEVSDTGVGMTEKQLQSFLKPFKKSSGADIKYGSGLGLFIVHQMLKQLESELIIDSKVGEGTKMTFSLPCQVEEVQGEEALHNRTQDISENYDNFNLAEQFKNELKYKEEEESPIICLKNKRPNNTVERVEVLETQPQTEPQIEPQLQPEHEYSLEPQSDCSYFILVDDEKFTLNSSARNLKKVAEKINKKIQIFETEDGIECLHLVYNLVKKGFRITAIISDELMIHMNGTTLAEILKKIKNLNTAQIPFFLLTAYPNVRCKFIDHLLLKPLNTKDAELILNS